MDIARLNLGSHLPGTESRTPFPELLEQACQDLTRSLHSDRSLLFLYDDRADAFSVVACQGESSPLVGRSVVADGVDFLTEALQELHVGVVAPGVFAPLKCETFFEGRNVLLVPLYQRGPVGVLAVAIDHRDITAEMERTVRRLGTKTAATILAGRPDWNHHCLFSRFFEVDPGGLAVLEGPDFVYSYANTTYRRILGRDTEALLGRSMRAHFGDEPLPNILELLERVLLTGEEYHDASLRYDDAFGPRYFEFYLIPERDREGVVRDIFVVVWPRTDAVVARQALETSVTRLAESQSMLKALLESTNNGIFFVGTDLSVLYVNRQAGELFGFDALRIVGRNEKEAIADTIAPHVRDPEGFSRRLFHLYDHMEETALDEVEVLRPVPRILQRYSAPVYRNDGELLGRVEAYSDITEIRNLARHKDDFLSLVSHELRTPVTSIMGYAQLLQRRARRESLPSQTLNAYDTIARQASRMQGLIDLLLDLSRLESGRLILQINTVNMSDVVRRVAEMTQMTTEKHRIALHLPAASVLLEGDEPRLEQVVTNLLSNAVRYSPAGGDIEVELGQDDNEITLSVCDCGLGISPEARAHIFERFYRVHGVKESTGMGIGLHITRGIVERHGGSIEVESELNKGSTFTVRLPRRQAGLTE